MRGRLEWSQHRSHKPPDVGSNPTPATSLKNVISLSLS